MGPSARTRPLPGPGRSTVAVARVDGDGVVTHWSRAAERLEGRPAADALGRPFAGEAGGGLRGQWPELVEQARRDGAGEALVERVRRDGSSYWADTAVVPLGAPDGPGESPAGYLLVFRDDTRRQLEQQASVQAHAELATQRLQSQRLETVGQLAGGVAHDFNNLLAGIISYTDLVAGSLAQEVTERGLLGDPAFVQLGNDVAEIANVANRAATLTRQLLIFSRREVVRPTVLDVNSVVAEMEKLLRRTIGEGVLLDVSLQRELPRVKADRGQIEQILMNLAVNARDAMSGIGGLRIETTAVELTESVRTLTVGRYVRLAVTDTGEGMAPEVIDRAFEPYFTTKPRGSGSGLGLATVYGIATAGGGDVLIDSRVGAGTTVAVLLPVTDEEPADTPDTWVKRPPRGKGETVLLVEDEATVRESVRRVLTRNNYSVLAADGPVQAVRLVQEHDGRIDVLLTDVIMPGRSGKDLADELTARLPHLQVVFMSGYSEDVIAPEGVVEVGVRLLRKPFTAPVLLRTVRAAVVGIEE